MELGPFQPSTVDTCGDVLNTHASNSRLDYQGDCPICHVCLAELLADESLEVGGGFRGNAVPRKVEDEQCVFSLMPIAAQKVRRTLVATGIMVLLYKNFFVDISNAERAGSLQ